MHRLVSLIKCMLLTQHKYIKITIDKYTNNMIITLKINEVVKIQVINEQKQTKLYIN